MIAYIKGELIFIHEESIVIDVGGIGYEVICPNPYIFQNQLNRPLFIYTYHHVREDAQVLFGFENEDEKYLFKKLISVSGIGPKSAIAILGSVDVADFISSVETEDEKYLTQFPGVGKKTARQIILDLKGKLSHLFTIEKQPGNTETNEDQSYLLETQEALKGLGYSTKEINKIMPELKKANTTKTDELIKKALSLLL